MPIRISWQGATLGANTFTGAQVAPSLALGGATIGSNALAVTGTIAADGGVGGGGLTYSAGSLIAAISVRGVNYVQGATIIPDATGSIVFGGGGSRASIKSSATGVIQVGLNAGTTGVSFDAATDGTLKLNNFANSAGAIVQAASLALGGATIGSNALAVTGTSLFSATLMPNNAPGINLGSAANRFGSAFFQSVGLTGYAPTDGGFSGGFMTLGGATIGSNALAVTGSMAISGALNGDSHIRAGATQSLYWTNRSSMQCPSDGVIFISNQASNDFNRLQFGGTTAAFPAIARSGTTLKFRTADDLGDAPITAAAATFSGALTVPGVTTAALTSTGTFTSGAGAQVGTLTNAPAAGNPTTWIKIIDNGTTRYIPAW